MILVLQAMDSFSKPDYPAKDEELIEFLRETPNSLTLLAKYILETPGSNVAL